MVRPIDAIEQGHDPGMPGNATEHQRELMRSLYRLHNGDEALICTAYARAESEGRVFRKRGDFGRPPEEYARAMLADGKLKGWLIKKE